jgi:hypothetical protein
MRAAARNSGHVLSKLPVADSPNIVYFYDHMNVTRCDCKLCENGPHRHCKRNPRMVQDSRTHVLPHELTALLPLRATV